MWTDGEKSCNTVKSATDQVKIRLRAPLVTCNKATGLDEISAHLLKDSVDPVYPFLTMLFNLCLQSGTFSSLRNARVVPLHKKGVRQDLSNYKPILLLPTLSGIIESGMHNQFYGYLTEERKKKVLILQS